MNQTDDTECLTCNGRGGTLEFDMQGDGVWATPVAYFHECPDCLGADTCPGCGAAIPEAERAVVHQNVDAFTCEACGWHYDADRFYDSYYNEPDYWPD